MKGSRKPWAKRWLRVPDDVRKEMLRLGAAGVGPTAIARRFGVSQPAVSRILGPTGMVIRHETWRPSEARLSLGQRIEIQLALQQGSSFRAIGARVGRAGSTICREVNANGGRQHYRPLSAHARAQRLARRPKPTKLSCNQALRTAVVAGLERYWSPEQISEQLKAEFGDDETMRISHETIYKSLYVQARGELRRELARCLRTGRAQRRPQARLETRGRLADIVLISERPAEVADRAVPGHWEGDLIVGKNNKSAIGTLVERSTRFVILLRLRDQSATEVRNAMTKAIMTLPESLRRSITWDQGREMSEHLQLRIDTGVAVYFCDPHSPWQRGSNENTNGLLRQYFPKSTDLSVHDTKKLEEVADSLNTRPRKTLGWKTPSQKFAELVASTG